MWVSTFPLPSLGPRTLATPRVPGVWLRGQSRLSTATSVHRPPAPVPWSGSAPSRHPRRSCPWAPLLPAPALSAPPPKPPTSQVSTSARTHLTRGSSRTAAHAASTAHGGSAEGAGPPRRDRDPGQPRPGPAPRPLARPRTPRKMASSGPPPGLLPAHDRPRPLQPRPQGAPPPPPSQDG